MAGQFRFKNDSGTVIAQISASNAGAISFSGSAVDFSSVTSLTLGTTTLAGTASFATTAVSSSYASTALTGSNAMTASSADTLYVRNNATVLGSITAQTLIVQTVTSSVDFVTGSTRFGSLLTNTHLFTGSLSITGSLSVVTTGTKFQVNASGVNIGNALTDSHIISGSVTINSNGLFVSSSGFVGINNVSPTVALDVTGTGKFSGILTLGSTISNGTYAYTLPSATGTLALTSALSGYLPLTGGTLTGALSGTSATFSGILFANANVVIGGATNTNELNIFATTSPTIKFQNSGADRGKISSNSSALVYNSLTGNGHNFQIDGVDKFTLAASTGAAYFSSSVSVNGASAISKLNVIDGFVSVGSSANTTTANTLLSGYGYIISGTTYGNVKITSSYNNGNNQAGLEFYTDNTGVATEKMRITSGGDLQLTSGVTILNRSGKKIELNPNSANTNTTAEIEITSGMDLFFKMGGSERLRFTSGGNILLGTSSDNGERLYVSGAIRATGTITANSDLTLKKNLLKIENALEKVEQINGYTYELKEDDSKRHAGVIAQEIQTVLPEIVNKGNDGILGVEYGNISALLIEAIKELKQEIDILKQK